MGWDEHIALLPPRLEESEASEKRGISVFDATVKLIEDMIVQNVWPTDRPDGYDVRNNGFEFSDVHSIDVSRLSKIDEWMFTRGVLINSRECTQMRRRNLDTHMSNVWYKRIVRVRIGQHRTNRQ